MIEEVLGTIMILFFDILLFEGVLMFGKILYDEIHQKE